MEYCMLANPDTLLRPVRIRNYIGMAAALELSPEKILQGSGIDLARLQDSDYLVSKGQCATVIENMLRLSANPGIGLEVGDNTDLLSFGIIGYALITCHKMFDTLDVWSQYSESLLGILSGIEIGSDAQGDMVMTVVDPPPDCPIFMFCVEEIFSMTRKTSAVECGVPVEFLRLELPYPAPAHHQRYAELFRCPILFDADAARATIARRSVELPLLANDEEFHRICLEHCTRILQNIKTSSPAASRVRQLLLATPQTIPSLQQVAAKLGMSARTLRRRLALEGHAYQDIVREFRVDLAREYLLSTDMSAKEVGYLLGFNDVHSFRRALKLWTGLTVKEYRAMARNDDTQR
jgi:AraC-like DNA-binding protein